MRGLIWLVALLAALWAGYWVVGSRTIRAGAEHWFAMQAEIGMVARHDGLAVRGFPNRFDVEVTAPVLADPLTGWSWQAPYLQILSMTWKPWHLILAFPADQRIDGPAGGFDLTADRMQASLELKPNTGLELDRFILTAAAPVLVADQGWVLAGDEFRLASQADDGLPNGQRIGLELLSARLDGLPPGMDLAGATGRIHLDALAGFTAPAGLRAAENGAWLDRLSIRKAGIDLGTGGSIQISGELVADAAGFAEGRLELAVQDPGRLLPIATSLGLLSSSQAAILSRLVTRTAGDSGRLALPLTLRNGQARLAGFVLGPAPRLNPGNG